MDIQGKTIWQQAAGDTNRDYVDLCLKWDVIVGGYGSYGSWPACKVSLKKDGVAKRKITDLHRFCDEMNEGDLVVLHLGTSKVFGVGEIVRGYEWRDNFNDVDGWDLAHVRRVRWLWKYNGNPKKFDTYTLNMGDATQRLNAPAVKTWLELLEISEAERERTLVDLPDSGDDANISVEDISEHLFDKGVSSNSISSLLDQMGELIRIANWYNRSGETPSENETVNYLVVPLLRALGWTPQRMAIEWSRIDVALFSNLPRNEEHLSVVVEAKKIKTASLSALPQAEEYAENYPNCRRIILTDGLRYGIFVRDERDQKFSLYAYMNLTRLRNEYPIYECKGVRDALLIMTPEWSVMEGG